MGLSLIKKMFSLIDGKMMIRYIYEIFTEYIRISCIVSEFNI